MTSSPLPEPIADESIEMIRSALTELESDRDQTEAFMNEMLDTFESLRADLADNEQKLRLHQEQLAARELAVEQSLSDVKKRDETQQTELKAANASLEETRQQVLQIQKERDGLAGKLDEAVVELASLAEVLDTLETTQAELEETRRQLKTANSSLRSKAGSDEVEKVRAENQRLEQELKQARQEAEQLAEQVKEQSQKRWSEEIGSMRQRIKNRTEHLLGPATFDDFEEPADTNHEFPRQDLVPVALTEQPLLDFNTPAAPAAPTAATAERSVEVTTPPNGAAESEPSKEEVTDPVVGSVLAQLAELDQSVDTVED